MALVNKHCAMSLLLVLLAVAVDAQNGSLLIPACKTSISPFCVEALGSVGAGVDARTYQDLAVVASGLLAANATSTAAKIDGLLRQGGAGAADTQCLRSCQSLYAGVVQSQPGCAAAIRGGKIDEARSSFDKSVGAVKQCEDGFGNICKVASPLSNGVSGAFLLAAASQPQLVTSINSFLYGACKTIAGGSGLIAVTFCIDALSSDSRSSNVSSYKEFAVIAVDLLTTNATATKSKIDGLLRNGGGARRHDDTVPPVMPDGQAAVGNAVKGGSFQEAISSLDKPASAVKECQNGFGKSNVASPLTAENDDAFQLAELIVLLIRDEP
uniref:Pectinesterase inhibitor domain-containing protein n=1 Tax=Leersia perrieri TaxID=77586 RepID=A0A0D9XNQ8_9ORYZ